MSILIKGMEMPKAQFQKSSTLYHVEGTIFVYPDGKARAELSVDYKERKSHPLVPVPPHGRLGDLDKLEQMFADIDNAPYSGFDGSEPFYSAEDAAQIIRLSPTIIPANGGQDDE